MIAFVVLATMAFSTNTQAQTTCTPAQKEACKKICEANQGKCTPEQIAACKKICTSKSAATAVATVNQSPQKTGTCGSASKSTANNDSGVSSFVQLTSLPTATETKGTKDGKKCNPVSCVKKKKE